MKQLSFFCTKDNTEFILSNGLTKTQYLSFSDDNERDTQSKFIMDKQFNDFVDAISEHSQNCDGQIVVHPTSYRVVD